MGRLLQILLVQLVVVAIVSGLFTGSSRLKNKLTFQLQQKVLTLGTSYTVNDDHGKPVYRVKIYVRV